MELLLYYGSQTIYGFAHISVAACDIDIFTYGYIA